MWFFCIPTWRVFGVCRTILPGVAPTCWKIIFVRCSNCGGGGSGGGSGGGGSSSNSSSSISISSSSSSSSRR